MSTASEVEIVEETPAPPSRPSASAIPKRKGRLPQAPPEPQPTAPAKKPKISPPNGNSNGSSRPDQAAFDALQAENEDLKRQLKEANEMATKFQEDFNKLQNLRFSDPEKALGEHVAAAEERERLLLEQNQMLLAQLPRLSEYLQPHSSGMLTLLTREETDSKLNAFRNEVFHLRTTVEEQKKDIDELSQAVQNSRLELDEEIKRSTSLTAQLGERQSAIRGGSKDGDITRNQLKTMLYEDLTNIKIHSAKQYNSEEFGQVTEFKCDCTTFGKTLFFRLELFRGPASEPNEHEIVDTVRCTPLHLDQEKDQAFLVGLDYLADTFTFMKDGGPFDKQMWEFGVAVNKHMRKWKEGEEEEEEEEEEDDEVQDMSMDRR